MIFSGLSVDSNLDEDITVEPGYTKVEADDGTEVGLGVGDFVDVGAAGVEVGFCEGVMVVVGATEGEGAWVVESPRVVLTVTSVFDD